MSDEEATTQVELSVASNIARIVISFPERRNPIGTETAARLTARLLEAEADPQARVIILTGAGNSFSSGGDLREFLSTTTAAPTEHWQSGEPWAALYRTLARLSKPIVCRVMGPALAGGCGIVASCDFAIASESATFGTPEAKIGLFPLFILPSLVRAVGRRHALDMALTGRTITAKEAAEMGLINRVVPDADLDTEVDKLAQQLATIGPITMSMGKRAFNEIAELDFDHGIEAARAMRVAFMGSPELQAGIAKFLSKSR